MRPFQDHQTFQDRGIPCLLEILLRQKDFILQLLIMRTIRYGGIAPPFLRRYPVKHGKQQSVLFLLDSYVNQAAPFPSFGILYHKEAWKLLIHYSELRYRQTPIGQIIRQQPTLYSIYTSIYNKRERPVVYHLCPTRNLAIFSSKDNILNAYISFPWRVTETQRTASPLNETKIVKKQ